MSDPLHQFAIQKIVPLEVAGIDISFTNSSLWMMIAIVASIVFFAHAMKKKALVPGRWQFVAESIYTLVAGLIKSNIGDKGKVYLPFIFTVFMTVMMGNLLGLIPWSFTYTSHIIVTAALAFMIFLTVVGIGVARHGVHFFGMFVPAGAPLWLMPLIIPIEVISYMVRPITLSVRLFANMMAGHLMLKVIAGFSVAMLGLGSVGYAAAFIPASVNVVLIGFEAFVALLQAYVFTLLACIYLKDTVEIHH